jgi:hypothetical protein
MDTPTIPPTDSEQKLARAWIAALTQATALRTAQRYEYQLLTGAPRIRATMATLAPVLAMPGGIESPVPLRALAAGVTLIHPAALLRLLAGLDRAPRDRRSRQAERQAVMEAWLRRQLGALGGA